MARCGVHEHVPDFALLYPFRAFHYTSPPGLTGWPMASCVTGGSVAVDEDDTLHSERSVLI